MIAVTVTLFFLYYSGKIRCGTWTTDGNKLVLCVGAVLLVRWFYYWVWVCGCSITGKVVLLLGVGKWFLHKESF
jgi:hypothetical protein